MPEPRELTELDVEFISLVAKPATGKPLILKNAGTPRLFAIKSLADEMQRAYGIVYAPDEVDSQGDTANAATVLKAATGFMMKKRQDKVDKDHSFKPEQAFVAESWIVRKGDPLFPDEKAGAWAVGIQVQDTDVWEQLKSGALTGLSLAGTATTKADPLPGAGMSQDQLLAAITSAINSAVEGAFQRMAAADDAEDQTNQADAQAQKSALIIKEEVAKQMAIAMAKRGASESTQGADDSGDKLRGLM